MTTQNNQPQNSDSDISVAEPFYASETSVTQNTPEVAAPVEAQAGESQIQSPESEVNGHNEEQTSEVTSEDEEQPVRPFTDFIEEFRQTEVQDAVQPEAPEAQGGIELTPSPEVPSEVVQLTEEALEVQSFTPLTGESSVAENQLPAVEELSIPSGEQPPEAAQVESTTEPAPTETAPVEEKPKPARRYRFDRPAQVPIPASAVPVQTHLEENKEIENRNAVSAQSINEQAAEREVREAQQQPKQAPAPSSQPAVQEATTTSGGATTGSTHVRKRRHGQERQREKEQPAPAVSPVVTPPASEEGAAVPEPVAQQTAETPPEDLPPLEYSELQAATPRRRRRRRATTSTSAAAVKAMPTEQLASTVPTEQPTSTVSPAPAPSPVAMPRIVTPSSPYNIVSGYTVSQMNQGNDLSGPFMGPEPSPARGSTIRPEARSSTRDGRRTPTYPARTSETSHSSASINHLTNIVAQAIQTQTDRMVAELRRANQVPTSVSVSLPPFPSTERVGVFVDVANLLYSARTLRITIDFGKLLDFLRGNRRLVRAHAYCPTSSQPGDEQMFLQAVKGLGYRITTKNYKTFSSGAKKADLDLDLCMDVVRLVDGKAVDCIILVSGDSDFMPMLDYCSDHGVRVEVAAFDEAMSATLRQSCDLFINLSMLDEIRA